MKITKIPGLGRFGVFIDDVDLNNISSEEWAEIGKLHLKSLVTIIRGNELSPEKYYDLITTWGAPRWNRPINYYLKYGKPIRDLVLNNLLDNKDRQELRLARQWQPDKTRPGMIRVTPKKNVNGEPIGIFGDGELLWHSNECGDTAFSPGVALMGWEKMIGSRTGFCTSVDWYERQSESFRSELDDMVVIHNYQPNKLNPVTIEDQEYAYKNTMCPENDSQLPLIIKSPAGIKGVHLGINTADYIVGMNKADSDRLFAKIHREMFVDEFVYHYRYEKNRGEILLFDNSITVHNRTLDLPNAPERVGYRIQFDYNNITGEQYQPFYQQKFNDYRNHRLDLLAKATEGMPK
jgi:alpha-ketoglutarate-dependent taurine dioxygenase